MSAKNVALATALGWTEIEPIEYWAEGWGWTTNVTSFKGKRPDGKNDHEVPDYEHDIAAGLAALQSIAASDQSVSVQIKVRADETLCGIEKGGQDVVVCYAATPAEAVFAALCAYYGIGE